MPFLVPLLDERGLGPAGIGLVLGTAGLSSLLAYPLWGAVADGRLGRRRTIALTSLTAALGGPLILLAGGDPLALAVALSVASVGAMPWGPLIDALALHELEAPADAYGRVRAWASMGWAVTAIGAGAVWTIAGPVPVVVAFSLSALVVAGLILGAVPGHGPSATGLGPSATGHGAATTARHTGPASLRSLPRQLGVAISPMLVGFLLGLFVTSMGEHAAARFASLRILDQGGSVLLVGFAAALPALVEFPVFGASRSLLALLGLRRMYVGGALIAALLAGLVALVPEAWMVTALRTLDGTSYALRYMAMVVIVGALLPGHLHALGQSLTWLVYMGVAPIIADVAGGLIYGALGAPALFTAATLTLLAGAGITWLALRGARFGRGASGEAVPGLAEGVPLPPPA
jgi:PPP family 3-phenylpropionic acid transporter